MQKHYDEYCQFCIEEKVTPFKPKGVLAFLGGKDTSNQRIIFVKDEEGSQSSTERALFKAYSEIENSSLCPSLVPQTIIHTLGGFIRNTPVSSN